MRADWSRKKLYILKPYAPHNDRIGLQACISPQKTNKHATLSETSGREMRPDIKYKKNT